MYQEENKTHDSLLQYFLITFFISWVIWIPFLFLGKNFTSLTIYVMFVGGSAPTLTAFLLTYKNGGKLAVKDLLKRGLQNKSGKKWFVPPLFLFPVLLLTSFSIAMILSNYFGKLTEVIFFGLIYPFIMLPITIFGGPINEEFGWRGFALDRLLSRRSPLAASLILGLIWAAWHIPLVFMDGTSQNLLYQIFPIGLLFQLLFIIEFTILLTWLHKKTQGSVLTAYLFHGMWNATFSTVMMLSLSPFGLKSQGELFTVSASVLNSIISLILLLHIVIAVLLTVVVIIVILKSKIEFKLKN